MRGGLPGRRAEVDRRTVAQCDLHTARAPVGMIELRPQTLRDIGEQVDDRQRARVGDASGRRNIAHLDRRQACLAHTWQQRSILGYRNVTAAYAELEWED